MGRNCKQSVTFASQQLYVMTFTDIQALVACDESRTLELKKSTGELKDGMHAACAFLNSDGGWLVFGVTPNSKKIVGQAVTDNTQQDIALALNGIEPSVHVNVEYIDVPDYSGNKIIAMHFNGWGIGQQPYTFHGRPYIKVESTTMPMTREMFEDRIRAFKPHQFSWELIESESLTINDLDINTIRNLIRTGVEGGRVPESANRDSIESILTKAKLMTNGKPNNGAAVLFANNTDAYPQLCLRMARFAGNTKSEFIDNQRVSGNIFNLIDAGMSFLFKHLNLSGTINGLQRVERLEIPTKALREALINALCHRQYEKYNLTASIAVYNDRVEISNPGSFPPQITPETIKQPHDSYPYNPNIAHMLYLSNFVESWGSGAHRIIDSCKDQGLELPVWSIYAGFVTVTFKRPKNTVSQQGIQYVTQQASQYVTLKVTQQVRALLAVLADMELSAKEIMNLLGLKDRPNFLSCYLNPALNAGLIEAEYPNKPRHPNQKYRKKRNLDSTEWNIPTSLQSNGQNGNVPQQVAHQDAHQASQQVRSLLAVLDNMELSAKEIMNLLGLKDRSNFLFSYLNPALNAGLIEAKYPAQPRHPNQKYRKKRN